MSRGAPDGRLRAALVAVASAVIGAACAPPAEVDPDAAVPEGPHPVAVDPSPGDFLVPTDKVIRIEFSDHLSGRSVSRYRFALYSGPIDLWVMSYYDPVRRQLVVWPSAAMRANAVWVLELDEGLTGLDGSPVAPGPVTHFTTGASGGDNLPFPALTFAQDIEPIFNASCASCHGGGDALAGVDLDSAEGVQATTLGVTAEGWPEWKRIVPGRPGESYLLYKIIGDERIAGAPMPRAFDDAAPTQLHPAEQQLIADWIAGGAAFFDPSAGGE